MLNPLRAGAAQVPEINRLAVLRTISQRGPFTKMDVVRDAHLSLPTVIDILASLQEDGYVAPAGSGESRGGRPPVLYQFNPQARFVLGMEIRIPRIAIGLVDLHAAATDTLEYAFYDTATSQDVTETLARGIDEQLSLHPDGADKLIGVGLGVPGFVDRDTGTWLAYPRVPGVRDLPLRAVLSTRLGVPVQIQNETNVYAAAELRRSGRQLAGDVLIITCLEGLKASVVVDGRILSGNYGDFGSVGHFIVEENGRPCPCGAKGCLEMYVSGYAFRQAVRARGGRIPGLTDLDDAALPHRVFAGAAGGDAFCRSIVEEAMPHMAYAFASLARLTDIYQVVLLGAFAEGGAYLQGLLRERVAQRLPDVARERLSIRIGSRLGTADVVAAAALPVIQASLGYESPG